MITLRQQLEVLPQTIIDFAEDTWIQILDHETSAHYRQDELRGTLMLGGEHIKDTYFDLLNREVTYVELNDGKLEIYIARR